MTTRGLRWRLAAVPVPMTLLIAAILITGVVAAMQVELFVALTSPLVASLLFAGTQTHLRAPAIAGLSRRGVFPDDVERRIGETFDALPSGEARTYLASLVRAAEPVRRALEEQPGIVEADEIDALLRFACGVATNLEDLDASIRALAGQPGLARATRLRYAMSQRFQRSVSVLRRLRVATIESDPAWQELTALLKALDEEANAYAAARAELRTQS